MIISIASGKGGTGKTTVATNLALAIGSDVQLLDCDVEEPNAHLFIYPIFEKTETVYTPVPEVDFKKCTFCGKCGEICQFKAIAVIADTVMLFHELCHSCGGCMAVCPEGAITEIGRELGIIERGHRNGLDFIHGKLRIGEAMSPPLIRKVRSYTDPDKLTLIDAPPGTSCPVITSMKETDFVLLVTEPTPFGLHDLKLASTFQPDWSLTDRISAMIRSRSTRAKKVCLFLWKYLLIDGLQRRTPGAMRLLQSCPRGKRNF